MDKLKAYFIKNFEQTFVLVVLVGVSLVYYFAPYKLAFLNVFFIPVLMAGYYLGVRSAATGTVLCVALVVIYLMINPDSFRSASESRMDIYMQIVLWASFLALTGIVTGLLYEHLRESSRQRNILNRELDQAQQRLVETRASLEEYSKGLEAAVESRVSQLEKDQQHAENIRQRIESVLHMSMDSRVAQLILQDKLRNEKKKISVLVADLEGFTSYTEQKQPEQVIQELNRYFADMSVFIQAYFAHIEKYTGDGVMLEFGAPITLPNTPLQAVVCGWRMSQFMQQSQYPWRMRIGLTTGDAVVGMIGSHRRAYTAMGNCANTAFRLEALCPPGSMLIDEQTYEAVKDYVDAKVFRLSGSSDEASQYPAEDMQALKLKVQQGGNTIDVMYQLAMKYMQHHQPNKAEMLFARILSVQPEHEGAKLGYAEASLRIRKSGVTIKGRSARFVLYEVQKVKNPLYMGSIPYGLLTSYEEELAAFPVPVELVWPSEISQGSFGHGARVALLSLALADQLGEQLEMTGEQRHSLAIAALLHDTGRQFQHADQLAERLDADHAADMHFEESARNMVTNGIDDTLAIECVLALGCGEKREVHPLAHVLRIANAYDALTCKQAWRDAWEPKSALEEMHHEAEKGKLDASFLQVFSRMLLHHMRPVADNVVPLKKTVNN